MKMKYVFASLLGSLLLAATGCGDDDHPVVPKMKKVTQIGCRLEGSVKAWDMNIRYDQDGNLYRVVYNSTPAENTPSESENFSELYQYNDNNRSITVTRFVETIPDINRTYTCSGQVVSREEEGRISDGVTSTYQYTYRGKTLVSIEQELKNSVTGATKIPYAFNWSAQGDMTEMTYNNTTKLQFVYGTLLHPDNFPLRAMKSTDLTERSFVDPVNLLFNANSRYLPIQVKEMDVLTGTTKATYTFTYDTVADYVTGMTMTVAKAQQTEQTYTYTFTYNYDPNTAQ